VGSNGAAVVGAGRGVRVGTDTGGAGTVASGTAEQPAIRTDSIRIDARANHFTRLRVFVRRHVG
jgi:hypothetical protein